MQTSSPVSPPPQESVSRFRACPLCNSRKSAWLLSLAQKDPTAPATCLRRCKQCKMVFLDRPCEAVAENGYYHKHLARRMQAMPGREELDLEYRRQLPALNETLARVGQQAKRSQPGRVLDAGCGSGFLLRRFQEQGWKTRGIDLDADCVAVCREIYGLDVSCESIDKLEEDQSFDCIVLTDALEHFAHPLPALRTLRRLLAPGGRLLIKAPNWNIGRFYVWTCKDKARFPSNLHIYWEHLNYFSPATLRQAFQAAGYTQSVFTPALSTYQPGGGSGMARAARGMLRAAFYQASRALPERMICSASFYGGAAKMEP